MADRQPEDRFSFEVEWFDAQANLVRPYLLFYHTVDDTIEIYDVKLRRTFLKRCNYPSVQLSDLYIGAQVNVYARQLKVLNYGDVATKKKLSSKQSRTLVVVKSSASKHLGKVLDHIYGSKLQVSKLKMQAVSQDEAMHVFGAQSDVQGLSGNIVAMEVVGEDVEAKIASLSDAGALVYVSSGERGDAQVKHLLENPKTQTTAKFDNCTVCLIRPHAILDGFAGSIVDSILQEGFEISAMQMFNLDRTAADEFLEVYRHVTTDYNAVADGLTHGPSLAIEVRGGADVVEAFRGKCGPADPEVARMIRPNTLRAEFGQNKVMNAVHCTDLPEDGVLESEYFFSLLQKSDAIAFERSLPITTYTGLR